MNLITALLTKLVPGETKPKLKTCLYRQTVTVHTDDLHEQTTPVNAPDSSRLI